MSVLEIESYPSESEQNVYIFPPSEEQPSPSSKSSTVFQINNIPIQNNFPINENVYSKLKTSLYLDSNPIYTQTYTNGHKNQVTKVTSYHCGSITTIKEQTHPISETSHSELIQSIPLEVADVTPAMIEECINNATFLTDIDNNNDILIDMTAILQEYNITNEELEFKDIINIEDGADSKKVECLEWSILDFQFSDSGSADCPKKKF